jgi:hypothetical protein
MYRVGGSVMSRSESLETVLGTEKRLALDTKDEAQPKHA